MLNNALIVLTIGGSGTRLWPLSRESFPKQFLDLLDTGMSLFQMTLLRAKKMNSKKILLIANYQHRFVILEQIRNLGMSEMVSDGDKHALIDIIFEPCGKNTMPVAIISAFIAEKYGLENVILLPSDHVVKNEESLNQSIIKANDFLSSNDGIVIFGISPNIPHIGYGYIKKAEQISDFEVFKVEKFIEKPNLEKAQEYIEDTNYSWNSGIFVYNAKFLLNSVEKSNNEMYKNTELAYNNMQIKNSFNLLNEKHFSDIKGDSIDYVLLEKTDKAFVMQLNNIGWNDLGNFDEIYKLMPKNEDENFVLGKNCYLNNVKNSHIINKTDNLLAVSDTENTLVVAMKDVIMIRKRNNDQEIKSLVEILKKDEISQAKQQYFDHRPWGYYENILEKDQFKIKKIIVKPNHELSYQMHRKRSEHWVFIAGQGIVIIDDKEIIVKADESIYIPCNAKHKIKNDSLNEDLIFIEVQCGSYFGEDDIIRIDDPYGRG